MLMWVPLVIIAAYGRTNCFLRNIILRNFYFLSRFGKESFDPGKKKRAKWTQNNAWKAISDVRYGHLSVNAMSKRHDVPRRTLLRYLTTKVIVKAKLGCKATLHGPRPR